MKFEMKEHLTFSGFDEVEYNDDEDTQDWQSSHTHVTITSGLANGLANAIDCRGEKWLPYIWLCIIIIEKESHMGLKLGLSIYPIVATWQKQWCA